MKFVANSCEHFADSLARLWVRISSYTESNDLAPIHQVEELVAIQDINPGLLRRFPPLQPQSKSASNLQRQRAA